MTSYLKYPSSFLKQNVVGWDSWLGEIYVLADPEHVKVLEKKGVVQTAIIQRNVLIR